MNKRKPTAGVGWMEFVMGKQSATELESLDHDPRSHMVNHLLLNGVTDAEVLISATEKLLDFIGEFGLFDKATPEVRALSNWRRNMVDRLMRQGLVDADQIISTANKLYHFLIFKMDEDRKKTSDSFNAQQGT